MKNFLFGILKLLIFPIWWIMCCTLFFIDIIRCLGGKSWLNLEDHLYVKFTNWYLALGR